MVRGDRQSVTASAVRGILHFVLWFLVVGIVAAVVMVVRFDAMPVNSEDLKRVQIGMSRSEVETVLGPPSDVDQTGATIWYQAWLSWGILYLEFDESGKLAGIRYDK